MTSESTGLLLIGIATLCSILGMFSIGICARNSGQNGDYGGFLVRFVIGLGLLALCVWLIIHGMTLIDGF